MVEEKGTRVSERSVVKMLEKLRGGKGGCRGI